jgi:hypothetical protein
MIVGALAFASAGAVGCSSSTNANPVDAGHDATGDATKDGPAADSIVPDTAPPVDSAPVDSGGPQDSSVPVPDGGTDGGPPRLLVTYGVTTSELYVVDVAGKAVAGMLPFAGGFGAPFSQPTAPYLLEQQVDVVARLDPAQPWTIDSSWNVAIGDTVDGGYPYSDPFAILVSAPNRAYVIRYARNEIAALDVSQTVDGGSPASVVDLSQLVQPADSDHVVEMTAGVYIASSKLLYVVLGNIDKNLVTPSGLNLFCSNTVSSVIAIDTTTNTIHSLGGTAPGEGIALKGFDPITGGVAYDAILNRLLIDEAGCNTKADGGGLGAIVKRGVEAVSLATGQTQILHDGTADGTPSQFVYIDATHAILGFDFAGSETALWDPTMTTLGASIANAPDVFVYDGVANLLGVLTTFGADGGSTSDVISVPVAGGAATTLLSNPFPMASGCGSYCVGGLDLWPRP